MRTQNLIDEHSREWLVIRAERHWSSAKGSPAPAVAGYTTRPVSMIATDAKSGRADHAMLCGDLSPLLVAVRAALISGSPAWVHCGSNKRCGGLFPALYRFDTYS